VRLSRCPKTCASKLRAGEAKRIPTGALQLAGYYLGCPACGFPRACSVTEVDFVETGMDVGETPGLTMGEVRCDRCGVFFRVVEDEIHVRRA
jgi:hypothetical protein